MSWHCIQCEAQMYRERGAPLLCTGTARLNFCESWASVSSSASPPGQNPASDPGVFRKPPFYKEWCPGCSWAAPGTARKGWWSGRSWSTKIPAHAAAVPSSWLPRSRHCFPSASLSRPEGWWQRWVGARGTRGRNVLCWGASTGDLQPARGWWCPLEPRQRSQHGGTKPPACPSVLLLCSACSVPGPRWGYRSLPALFFPGPAARPCLLPQPGLPLPRPINLLCLAQSPDVSSQFSILPCSGLPR